MGNYILSEDVIGNFEWQIILVGCKMYGKTDFDPSKSKNSLVVL